MKWKQVLTIGLSAAMIMSAVPAEGVLVYADTEMEGVSDDSEEISITDEKQSEDNLESSEVELTEDADESVGDIEELTTEAEESEESDEENTDEDSLFSDDTEDQTEAAGADSEYGTVVASDTISDETSGTEITWTVYDSGKLVLEGTGATPDWSPWFENKESITDVIVGDGITTLGERNFMNYPALKTVTFQGSMSKISNSAFEGCKLLKNIIVEGKASSTGMKLIQLGECAFQNCTGLESAEFTGNFVTDKNAFDGCTSLKSIKANESSISMLGNYTFSNCTALTNVDLPVRIAKEGAFANCTALKKFDFANLSSIGNYAFMNCSSLESIKIPDKVTSIAEGTFYGCSALKSIELPKQVTTIGANAFMGCSGIKTLKIPGNVQTIGKTAFAKCTGLEELEIEEGVQIVEEAAFAECSSLNAMILPKSVSNFATNFVTDYNPVKRICYRGTREQWIAANLSSDIFYNARIYFEYNTNHTHQMITRSYIYTDSCTQPGTRETFCSICGYVKSSEEIPVQGHDWKIESAVKNTCTNSGVNHLVCSRCGEKKDETIPAAGHNFSEWKTTTEATVFSAAEQTRTCSVCGRKETRTAGNKLAPAMKVNATRLPLKTKQKTKTLKVTGLAKGDSVAVWKSSNIKVAKVTGSANGTCIIIAGKKTGKAIITVTLKSGLKKNITVNVQKKVVKTTKIAGVTKKVSLKKGRTLTLKPAITPLTSLQKVTYKSSNKKVATVTSKGVIRARKKGTAVITVKSGSKTVKCKVTVK